MQLPALFLPIQFLCNLIGTVSKQQQDCKTAGNFDSEM